ncbi:MAG: alpha/beta fold hydrolase [Chloroflexota bacterium]
MASPSTNAIFFPITGDDSSTHNLVGIYYLCATEAPAPFALLLHGIPGSQQNHDLANWLRDDGWHVLVLYFRGCWGSGGDYNATTQVRDARAALDYVLSEAAPRPVDPERVAVLGYSLGSRAALLAAVDDARVKAVVSVSGFADFSEVMMEMSFFEGITPLLHGSTVDGLLAQWQQMGTDMQPYEALAHIAPRPVLVIHGTGDNTVPVYNADALNGDSVTHVRIDDADHGFNAHRTAFIEAVHRFLNKI